MKSSVIGFCIGLWFAGWVFIAKQTTPEMSYALVVSFPVFFGVAGYLIGQPPRKR